MTLDQARNIVEEIIQRYGITHSTCHEERTDGSVKFLRLTISLKIEDEARDEVRVRGFAKCKGRGNGAILRPKLARNHRQDEPRQEFLEDTINNIDLQKEKDE
jgi:hypothetical protein